MEKLTEREVEFLDKLSILIDEFSCDFRITENRLCFSIDGKERILPYNLSFERIYEYILINSTEIGEKHRKELERLDEISFQINSIYEKKDEKGFSELSNEDKELIEQLEREQDELVSLVPKNLLKNDYLDNYPALARKVEIRQKIEELIAPSNNYTLVHKDQIESFHLQQVKEERERRKRNIGKK